MPSLDYDLFTESGERGWIGTWHTHEHEESMVPLPQPVKTQYIDETRLFISTSYPENITKKWTLKLTGYLKPREHDCKFEFGLTAAGRAKVMFFFIMDSQLTQCSEYSE
jgi:beta-glucosidase